MNRRDASGAGAIVPAARPLITGENSITLELTNLNVDLTCPVCLGVLKNVVVTDCLHRFCCQCMEKCLRQGKKECPSCRHPVATRRSLRPDPNLNCIIQKLFPDLAEYEAEQEAELARVDTELTRVAQEREEQMKVQGAELRARAIEQETDARRVRKAADKDAAHARASSAVALSTTEKAQRARRDALAAADAQASRSLSRLGKSHKKSAGLGALGKRPLQPAAESLQAVRGVDRAAAWRKKKRLEKAGLPPDVAEGDSTIVFAFTRHPDEHHVAKLEREVLQTSRKLQVHHLLKFLVLKLKLKESAWTSFCLSLRQTPSVLDMVPAPSSLMLDSTLDAIVCSHLSDPSQLVLEYRLKQGVTLQDVRKELSAADGSAGPSAAGAAGP